MRMECAVYAHHGPERGRESLGEFSWHASPEVLLALDSLAAQMLSAEAFLGPGFLFTSVRRVPTRGLGLLLGLRLGFRDPRLGADGPIRHWLCRAPESARSAAQLLTQLLRGSNLESLLSEAGLPT